MPPSRFHALQALSSLLAYVFHECLSDHPPSQRSDLIASITSTSEFQARRSALLSYLPENPHAHPDRPLPQRP